MRALIQAEIIKQLLARSIPVVGCLDATLGGLLVPRAELRQLICGQKARIAGRLLAATETEIGLVSPALSVSQAAKELACPIKTIGRLIRVGQLDAIRKEKMYWVCPTSLSRFKRTNIELNLIAIAANASVNQVVEMCQLNGIPFVPISRWTGAKGRGFIRAEYQSRLLSLLLEYKRKRAA